jgi:hypothetical protein
MSPRRLATGALLAVSACAHGRTAGLSEADELYRLAIVSLSGVRFTPDRPVCLAVAGGDPTPALLAAVRARVPRALPKSQCPTRTFANAIAQSNHQWLELGRIYLDHSGVASFGWTENFGLGGTCNVQPPGAEYRVFCMGI